LLQDSNDSKKMVVYVLSTDIVTVIDADGDLFDLTDHGYGEVIRLFTCTQCMTRLFLFLRIRRAQSSEATIYTVLLSRTLPDQHRRLLTLGSDPREHAESVTRNHTNGPLAHPSPGRVEENSMQILPYFSYFVCLFVQNKKCESLVQNVFIMNR
jgi:hypothetical protein